jgi:hypothetical protein
MSTKTPTPSTIDAYDLLETSLNNLETWKAILPLTEEILPLTEEIVGLNGKQVNLFDFLDDYLPERPENKFAIRFDASRWPPTNDGRQALTSHLQAIAEHNGTILIRDGRGVLICTRGRPPRVTNEQKSRTFDSNGVAVDIRGMSFHHDRKNQRLKGRQKRRATKTNKDTTGICKCKLRLTLNIHHEDQSGGGFIFLSRKGNAFHTFHPQPPSGSLMMSKRNVNPDIVDLIRKGQNACIPNTNMRKLAFETRQELIWSKRVPVCQQTYGKGTGPGN